MPTRSTMLVVIALAGSSPAQPPADDRLCRSESVSRAVELFRGGEIDAAEKMLRAELQEPDRIRPADRCKAAIVNNLAAVTQTLGRFAEAESLYLKVIEFWKKAPDGDDVLLTRSLNNLASLYIDRRDYPKAERMGLPALLARLEATLPGHPDVATLMATIGVLDTMRGRYAEAEHQFLRSLAVWRSLGPDGPEAMHVLNNLASLYKRMGRIQDALAASRRALDIGDEKLSPDHPSWVLLYAGAAKLGGPAEAEGYYRRALAIAEAKLGPSHPVVGRILVSYAQRLRELKRGKEARKCEVRARGILASAFPSSGHTVDAADLLTRKR